jgi:hypothetical protein
MNGCLFKSLLLMTLLVALFLGFPYIKQYLSNGAQDKVQSLESQATFLKKFARELVNQKSKNNDDTKNQETGK